jgi:cytochrome c-type protein NapB
MKSPARKLAVVAALVAFTTGLSGYFMGQLQADRSAAARSASQILNLKSEILPSAPDALAAPTYADLAQRTHQPNHAWKNSLADLPPAPAFTAATPPLSRVELDRILATRAERRAYNGAPPTVPHPIDQSASFSCLACHGQPTRIGGRDVPQLSHPAYTSCIQCHAPQNGPGSQLACPPAPLATPVLANTFAGLPPPAGGTRAHPSAPPTMPHTTQMRQNCLSCHGPGGSSAIKTPHPQQSSCLQCHATDAARETLPPPLHPFP